MLLAIDIGNTNITFGLFRGRKLARRFNIPTKGYNFVQLKKKIQVSCIDNVVISSVVPGGTKILAKDLKRYLNRRPYIIGKDIIVPIRNLYRKPKQVGQDRLLNAYAGMSLYGAPLIIIDFGTAITFDAVSRNKEYLGGMILPGLKISLEALAGRTALLPEIKLEKPREFIGRDTKNSMLCGVVYGFAALADSLAIRIKDKIGKDALVIGTGGNIGLLKHYCRNIDAVDSNLILKGLNLLGAGVPEKKRKKMA